MDSFDYFTVTAASMDQDLFEIEMTKALEEIFSNLRQLKESRSEKRLSMDTDNNEVGEESFEHVEGTEDVETSPEKEAKEEQVTDIFPVNHPQVPRSRSENRRLSMDTDKNEVDKNEAFEHVERTYENRVETNHGKETQEKQVAHVVPVKPQPRRRRLPGLPTVKKS